MIQSTAETELRLRRSSLIAKEADCMFRNFLMGSFYFLNITVILLPETEIGQEK